MADVLNRCIRASARCAVAFVMLQAVSVARAQYTWSGLTCVQGDWTVPECWCQDCEGYPDGVNASAIIEQGEPSITSTIQLLSLETRMQGSVLILGDLLYSGSAITNAGQIRLLGGRILPLGSEPSLTLGGPGNLVLDGAAAAQAGNIVSVVGTTLINSQEHTISGRGALFIPITNRGTIDATGDLRLAGYDVLNTAGLLKSSAASGRLRIDHINCTGGLLQADAGVINLVVSILHNTTLRPGDGELTIGDYLSQSYIASSSFDSVTLDGNTRVIFQGELNIPNPCTNNGVMHVDAGGRLRLILPGGALVGSGSVLLEPGAGPLGDDLLEGFGRGIGPDQTIHGSGTITYGLDNYGDIFADLPGKHLLLTTATAQPTSQYSNQGVIGAAAGGVLRLEYCDVVQMFGGSLRSQDAGSRLITNFVTLDGGDVVSSGGGTVEAAIYNHWGHGVHVQADVTVTPGTLGFFGVPIAGLPSATIDGQITIAGTESPFAAASVELPPDGLLEGNGSFLLVAPSEASLSAARLIQSEGASTIGPGITIHGSGQFRPFNTTLQGLLRAEGNGRSLVIPGCCGQFVNTGTLGAATGASLVIQSRTIQNAGGTLDPAGGRIRLENATIVGGINQGVGSLDSGANTTNTLSGLVNQGTIAVRAGSTLNIDGPMQNDGVILVNPDASPDPAWVQLTGTRTLTGTGELRLLSPNLTDGLQLLGNTVTNGVDHTIRGSSRVFGSIDNYGHLSTASVPITWPVDGSLTLRSSSRLHIDLVGAASASIVMGSTAALGGQLQVVQTVPTNLSTGTTFTLLSASSITGAFDSTLLPAPPAGRRFALIYTPTAVLLRFTFAGDFDNDGVVSVPDIFAFLSAWFAGLPSADFDNDGMVSVPDIFAFLSAWFAG